MELKPQTKKKKIRMITLYRDDLIFIEKVLKQLQPRSLSIEDSKAKYKSVDDIPVSDSFVRSLSIWTWDPDLHISFVSHGAEIYTSSNDLKVLAAMNEIVDRLKKRENKFKHYFVGIMSYGSGIILPSLYYIEYKWQAYCLLGILVVSAFCIFVAFKWHSKIYYKERPGSFFERKKDDIILNGAYAIIGFVLGIVATKIAG